MTAETSPSTLRELWRRRIPQILGTYLGVGLALIPFVGFLVDRYSWSSHLIDAVLVAFVSMIPSVALLAWNHGAPGKDPWILAERVGIPINLALATVAVAWVLLSGSNVEAITDTVVVTDEDGNRVEALVPKAEHREKLGIYFWTNTTGDPDLAWLSYGLPMLLDRDLEQNLFIRGRLASSASVLRKLRRAGLDDALGVPLPLKHEIARTYGQTAFLDGQVGRDGELFTATVTLYDAETATPLAELEATASEPLGLVDPLSEQIRSSLEIKQLDELGRDLPILELTSASPTAVRSWAEGEVAVLLANDSDTAIDHFQHAVEDDPSFAVAWVQLAARLQFRGQVSEALDAIHTAQRHKYRLSERERFLIRAFGLQLQGENQKIKEVCEMWAELYPDDTFVLRLLSQLMMLEKKIPEAIGYARRLLEVDPGADDAWKTLGALHTSTREYDQALEAYRHFAELRPDDGEVLIAIAQVERLQGDLDAARASAERATYLDSGPTATLELYHLDIAIGDLEAAAGRLEEAQPLAASPQDEVEVLAAQLDFYDRLGQPTRVLDNLPRLREIYSRFQTPIYFEQGVLLQYIDEFTRAGRGDEIEARFQAAVAGFESPVDRSFDFNFLEIQRQTGNLEGIESWLPRAEEALEIFAIDLYRPYLDMARGKAFELQGQAGEAAAAYARALQELDGSLFNTQFGMRVDYLTQHARASLEAGDLSTARSSLEKALRISPADPKVLLVHARVAMQDGDLEAARQALDRVLATWRNAEDGDPYLAEANALRQRLSAAQPG